MVHFTMEAFNDGKRKPKYKVKFFKEEQKVKRLHIQYDHPSMPKYRKEIGEILTIIFLAISNSEIADIILSSYSHVALSSFL